MAHGWWCWKCWRAQWGLAKFIRGQLQEDSYYLLVVGTYARDSTSFAISYPSANLVKRRAQLSAIASRLPVWLSEEYKRQGGPQAE